MNKFLILTIVLIIVGAACFAIAGYIYWTLDNLYKTLVYYSLESQYYTRPEIIETAFNLKFGIAKFSLCGIGLWVSALIFFLKRKKI